MNKKIKKSFKKISKLKKVIKNHIIDPTPSETVIATTILSAAISGIIIGAGGTPVIAPVLAGSIIAVGTVSAMTYIVEKINESENNSVIEGSKSQNLFRIF
ncbi:hypothetical protein [Spiroplasma ixodetis]|uniref:Uncharacterized protein n=1 Tax=Spiroplasma ixodetis TaxID=2141 RepID=A0ABM8BVG0_9MOLU|nr:hypothetical protein [Spiroplasma ixodetis]BDT03856.1 hypothetical protein SHM_15020 [Spiroplasma ixodetis]